MKTPVGVILAAGRGTRMMPFSEHFPKPLLPICNKPLIVHQIEAMRHVGIDKIIIVVGHLGFEISKTLGDGRSLGVSLEYIEQKETKGIAHALGQIESKINNHFLLFLGDIFFVAPNLIRIFDSFRNSQAASILATQHGESVESIKKNFSVLTKEGRVYKVVEKPRFPAGNIKGCGLYLFSEHIFDAIRRTPKTAARDEYELTESIQILIDNGLTVLEENVVDVDINLTTPQDLLRCNMVALSFSGNDSVVGERFNAPLGANICTSVIGKNVLVENRITINESLIFPNSIIKNTTNISHAIITPDHFIDCRVGV